MKMTNMGISENNAMAMMLVHSVLYWPFRRLRPSWTV